MPEEVVPTPRPAPEQAPAPLESDLSRLAAEVAKHKENPEMAGASEREMIRQSIRSMVPAPPSQAQKTGSDDTGAVDDSVLPAYMDTAAPAAKLEVEDLLRMAFKDGITKATHAAQRSNPFILDAFHDALAGKLHEELKKRKII
jgi:hypothetical protein